MQPVVSVICLSVCLPLCLSVSCAETAGPIKVPFGAWICGAESTMYLTEARIPHGKWYFWGIILGHAPTCLRSIFSTITSTQMTLSSFFPVLFTPCSTTATLYHNLPKSQITRLQQNPELSCTCCCQSSQIQSHHSHPSVSTLAKDN